VWEPITKRAEIVVLTKVMPESKSEAYTTSQLAHALLCLCDNPTLVEQIEELDREDKPLNEYGERWYAAQEAKQETKFKSLLDELCPMAPPAKRQKTE